VAPTEFIGENVVLPRVGEWEFSSMLGVLVGEFGGTVGGDHDGEARSKKGPV